jgi:hypothetical protein
MAVAENFGAMHQRAPLINQSIGCRYTADQDDGGGDANEGQSDLGARNGTPGRIGRERQRQQHSILFRWPAIERKGNADADDERQKQRVDLDENEAAAIAEGKQRGDRAGQQNCRGQRAGNSETVSEQEDRAGGGDDGKEEGVRIEGARHE